MIEAYEIYRGLDEDRKIVASAIRFDGGKVVISLAGKIKSIGVYDNIQQVKIIHGHDNTEIVCVAKLDFSIIQGLYSNQTQDIMENVGCGFKENSTEKYLWDQREKILRCFERETI